MAVQAQHSSDAVYPNYLCRGSIGSDLEGIQAMQARKHHFENLLLLSGKRVLFGDSGLQVSGLPNASVFSDHPQSDLTCNVSGTRKRGRHEHFGLLAPPAIAHPLMQAVPNTSLAPSSFPHKNCFRSAVIPALPVNCEQSPRVFDSSSASTSGRPDNVSTQLHPVSFGQEILSNLCHQNFEMESFIRFQNERIRLGVEEIRMKHCKSILSYLEQRVAKRLHEKEAELEDASRKNAELEEKIRQMSSENQIWYNLAKNNEALVSNLKINLEQALQNSASVSTSTAPPLIEGYGDSDGTPLPEDAVRSLLFECDAGAPPPPTADMFSPSSSADPRRMICRVCGETEVCVLVLPCRHLSLCKGCETIVGTCPICNHSKNACLRVYMS